MRTDGGYETADPVGVVTQRIQAGKCASRPPSPPNDAYRVAEFHDPRGRGPPSTARRAGHGSPRGRPPRRSPPGLGRPELTRRHSPGRRVGHPGAGGTGRRPPASPAHAQQRLQLRRLPRPRPAAACKSGDRGLAQAGVQICVRRRVQGWPPPGLGRGPRLRPRLMLQGRPTDHNNTAIDRVVRPLRRQQNGDRLTILRLHELRPPIRHAKQVPCGPGCAVSAAA